VEAAAPGVDKDQDRGSQGQRLDAERRRRAFDRAADVGSDDTEESVAALEAQLRSLDDPKEQA